MTYRKAVTEAVALLERAGITEASIDARLLLEYACGISRTHYLVHMMDPMPQEQEAAYLEAVRLRSSRVPLQQITGSCMFMGLEFYVNEHVLCPRQDTETLVEEAEKYLTHSMRILDLCTGSGCILISLLHGHPELTGVGADLSDEALAVARENCRRNQVSPELIHSDLFDRVEGTFDLMVSNPPYIPTGEIDGLMPEVSRHEPRMALDGKEDGLYFYRRIACEAGRYLNPQAALLLEIGFDQGAAVAELLEAAGFAQVRVIRDLSGNDRVVAGLWQAQ